jgi:hypothetical protein
VVLLVAVAQTLEDLDGLLRGGLVDDDLLKAALQGGVALQVFAVLLQSRCADGLQLTSGQGGLEDRGRVDRALGRARADEVVQLVDEQDDVAALGDLLHHLLQPFLELTAVLGARDQSGEIQRVDLLALEELRHVGVGDPLGQALDDGRLADARLTDEHRIVLRAPGEDLHDPLDLGLTTDDGVQLALGGELGEVAAELVQQLGGLLALATCSARPAGRRSALAPLTTAGTRQHADDLVADLLGIGVEIKQDASGDALVLAHQSEQDVLGSDVVVAEAWRAE